MGRPCLPAPQVGSIPDFHLPIVNPEVNGPFGCAFDNHRVETGFLELSAKPSTKYCVSPDTRQGGLAGDQGTIANGRRRAGQDAGGENNLIFGTERIDARLQRIIQHASRKASSTEVFAGQRVRERLLLCLLI